jgi:hypothetical protein
MFLPNTTGLLTHKTGQDRFAQATYAEPKTVPCGIVHLNKAAAKTSVRTDSSASRGNAEEQVSVAKILFPITVAIVAGDKFEIQGITLRVLTIEPRLDVLGRHDHNEVDFGSWAR